MLGEQIANTTVSKRLAFTPHPTTMAMAQRVTVAAAVCVGQVNPVGAVCGHTNRADAWLDYPWGDPYVQSVFTARRFTDIWQCLHFVDNTKVKQPARKADKFWKISVLITALNKTFQWFLIPAQWLSVDEMTVAMKGRHGGKQYPLPSFQRDTREALKRTLESHKRVTRESLQVTVEALEMH
jgi:hypothetical protein